MFRPFNMATNYDAYPNDTIEIYKNNVSFIFAIWTMKIFSVVILRFGFIISVRFKVGARFPWISTGDFTVALILKIWNQNSFGIVKGSSDDIAMKLIKRVSSNPKVTSMLVTDVGDDVSVTNITFTKDEIRMVVIEKYIKAWSKPFDQSRNRMAWNPDELDGGMIGY